MLRVRCQATATLDPKGRLALPAPLRHALAGANESALVLTFNRGAIWGWTRETFENTVEAPLETADQFDTAVQDFIHAVVSIAQDVEIDGSGRIRIPALLRERAGLTKDVVVNSVLDRVEIWDREAWEQRFAEALERSSRTSGLPVPR